MGRPTTPRNIPAGRQPAPLGVRSRCELRWRVVSMVESLGLQPTRTAYRSPWQNGVAERWIGSVRRELLDQVVVFNERHLRRLLNEYVAYYHDDRTHDALAKETPAGRRPASPIRGGRVEE